MNRVLVAQAAAGLAAYLLERASRHPSVVIGYDGRKNSRVFARDTAELMAGAGVRAILLPRLLPTPVLAFAVRHLDASAGVMVTASHNPPHDNGYKVYLGGDDQRLADRRRPPTPRSQAHDPRGSPRAQRAPTCRARPTTRPRTRRSSTSTCGAPPALAPRRIRRALRFVYTAMHGVGWETARRVFAAAGFGEPIVVAAQIEPDPDFPTVAFPNPEEPGAHGPRLRDGRARRAPTSSSPTTRMPTASPSAIPDAPQPAGGAGSAATRSAGCSAGGPPTRLARRRQRDGTLACSLVSSPALGDDRPPLPARLRRDAHRLQVDLARAGGLAFGFEEALGYLVDPEKVRDKDGISAAVEFLGLSTELKAAGTTLARPRGGVRREVRRRTPRRRSRSGSTDLAEIPRMMDALRPNPPATIGAVRVDRIDDFADGFEQFPPSDILRIRLDDGSRVIVRPSGTEPKLKVYIDASSTEGTAAERSAAAERTVAELDAGMRRAAESGVRLERELGLADCSTGVASAQRGLELAAEFLGVEVVLDHDDVGVGLADRRPRTRREVRITWASAATDATEATSARRHRRRRCRAVRARARR